MEFNPEMTLKENNVSMYIESKDFQKEGLQPPGKCMEINCAFGHTTRYFLLPELHQKSTIIGTDSSETMIKYARRKFKDDKRIEFDVFNIQTKSLPNEYINQFDHIFSFPTVHSRNDYLQEFQNVYTMLKPDGKFHMSMVICHDAFRLYSIMGNHPIYGSHFKKYLHPLHYANDPEIYVQQLLVRAGFFIEYFSFQYAEYKVKYLLPYILYGLPFINELSLEHQKKIKEEMKYQFNKMEKNVHIIHRGDSRYNQNVYRIDNYIISNFYAYKSNV